jgi:CBS domain-containing protein
MRIREILNLKGDTIYSIAPSGLLSEAVNLMVKHDVGSLVVLSEGAMVGMVTSGRSRLWTPGRYPGRQTVQAVMGRSRYAAS